MKRMTMARKIFRKRISLKYRVFVTFFSILLIIILFYLFITFNFITRFTEDSLEKYYSGILAETTETVERLIWNLSLTSEQLLRSEGVVTSIMNYKSAYRHMDIQTYYNELVTAVSILTMPNTDVALISFIEEEAGEIIYSDAPLNREFTEYYVLHQTEQFLFQGPHRSRSNFIGGPVISLRRSVYFPNDERIALYIESGLYSLDVLLHSAERLSAYIVFTDGEDQIVYSTFPDERVIELHDVLTHHSRNYRVFTNQASHGFKVHIIVPRDIFQRDFQMVISDFLVGTVILIMIIGVIAFYFWKSIFHPLKEFEGRLNISLSSDEVGEANTIIPEYELLFEKIEDMKEQIRMMLKEAVEQEKVKSQMELTNLRLMINPHFVMNTLNTIHWLALLNKQSEIDNITQSLTHLLSYNLDKDNKETNLVYEVRAVEEYVKLQKVRYQFEFLINSNVPLKDLRYPCPKFFLQPIIENCLIHGYREGMMLTVEITVEREITIEIIDNGLGIKSEKLAKLDRNTFGIGLNYVLEALGEVYHGDYKFDLQSQETHGTKVTLVIPKLEGRGYNVEDINRR